MHWLVSGIVFILALFRCTEDVLRYLGNKTNLLSSIDSVLEKYEITGETFIDLFSGTGSVGDHFKNRYKIISNDYMYFASVLANAKTSFGHVPEFTSFVKKYKTNPFDLLNSREYEASERCFVLNNYSPIGDRMYFTEENALRIDGMRMDIEEFLKEGVVTEQEYMYLLASLLECSQGVANTSGTFQAYFKFWETRAKKRIAIAPLEMSDCDLFTADNQVFCENANRLVRHITGDIAYIDPPYTVTQYANSYHVLETIARYDNPLLFGKTGRRKNRILSDYSNKKKAIHQFEDLFRQIDVEHVLISYSNQSIVPLDALVKMARLFAVNGEVYIEKYKYREYASNNYSYKGGCEGLKEAIIYFKKNRCINKSPLNYSGSKDGLMPRLTKVMPEHVGTFVDAMGGAFNVGANTVALNEVVYNEYNPFVFEIVKMLTTRSPADMIASVEEVVTHFGLTKKNKEAYVKLRDYYNDVDRSPVILYTLQIYAFQNMIRFNSSHKMNTPVGNNEFNDGTRRRILDFRTRSPLVSYTCGDYKKIDIQAYPADTLFYFDPPYFITSAEYNDGKRGFDGWGIEREKDLLDFLLQIDDSGRLFMLSNTLEHKGKVHHILQKWIQEHGFYVSDIGITGVKYPRTEVVVTNYMPVMNR